MAESMAVAAAFVNAGYYKKMLQRQEVTSLLRNGNTAILWNWETLVRRNHNGQ